MTSSTPPGGRKPPPSTDDPWERLARNARAAQSGDNPLNDEIGDTSLLVTGSFDAEPNHVTGTFQRQEMLKLVEDSLAAAPDRGDLWMMRFETQRVLAMKQEFFAGLLEAWKKPAVFRQLDWPLLRAMWHEIAPGEPLPEAIKLPDASGGPRPVAPAPRRSPPRRSRPRRPRSRHRRRGRAPAWSRGRRRRPRRRRHP
jgi:hypothetical protein